MDSCDACKCSRAFARRICAPVFQSAWPIPRSLSDLWRMMIATRLMRDSDLQLAAIAAQIGYSSEYAFAHAFKRLHGISPGAYRRGWKKPGG
ncbi:hypothetical protein CWO90_31990 [Bradyrhizobium sp. Leo121]|nr:hypothetical protein CWO90_31990 [Bradyrhizobium sp. Leo121]